MTTEQSHEASAGHSCGCGHDHGESHESPKPQEVVVESPQPQTQSGNLCSRRWLFWTFLRNGF